MLCVWKNPKVQPKCTTCKYVWYSPYFTVCEKMGVKPKRIYDEGDECDFYEEGEFTVRLTEEEHNNIKR